jgi:hypothetical protein
MGAYMGESLMLSNTLKRMTANELQRAFDNVHTILMTETFGSDHEAYYELCAERSQLFRELNRRKASLPDKWDDL